MGLTFTPVAPGNKTGDFDFDDEFVQEFFEAWDYLSQNPDKYLKTEFSSSQYRESWLEKAKAYGLTKPKGEEIVVRRVKRTGSSDPNTGQLCFVMEAKSVADARHARLRAEAEDRERRRANGEEVKRGKRRTSRI
jgi:hypothetical protein